MEEGVLKISKEDLNSYFNGECQISMRDYIQFANQELNKKLSLFYHIRL